MLSLSRGVAFLSFSIAASLGTLIVSGGCGGTATSIAPVSDAAPPLPETGDPAEAGDARSDAPPLTGEPLAIFGAYAVRRIYLGETDRSGAPTKDAWKSYGENLDGLVSTKTANGECKLVAGADSAKREDGQNGIDNSFGRTILGFLLGLIPTPSKLTTDEIAKGGRTMMLNLQDNPARFGLLAAAATGSPPLFNGTDVRAASASTVSGGSPDNALSTSSTPSMSGRTVSSGPASGTFYLDLPLQGAVWRLPIRHARVTMTISGDGLTATNGTISGIAPTQELVDELVAVAGRISTQLCGGSTLDTIKQTIRQASDILVDGAQDPNQECNGVSIGIGFEAVRVTASGVALDPKPLPDPCVP